MKVYGVFRTGDDSFAIWTGKVTDDSKGLVTVDYGAFSWTYRAEERGRTFFDTLDAADAWAAELRTMMRFQEG